MMRIFIDKLGDGHQDIFLKIDVTPGYLQTADSYFLSDFLELPDEPLQKPFLGAGGALKYQVVQLLHYWVRRITSIKGKETKFIPFDLSDQYVGGLLIEKASLGFKIKPVYTTGIHGYSVSQSNLDARIKEYNVVFDSLNQAEYLLAEYQLLKGLQWSIDELMTVSES